MSNIAGKAYALNALTSMPRRVTWFTHLSVMMARAFPGLIAGLFGLGLIHFARWIIIRNADWPDLGQPRRTLPKDHMLFASNFNGTWNQYADSFASGLPLRVNGLWYGTTRFPGAIPARPFKTYIRDNQIDTNYYYNATPGSGQRDIKLALKLANDLREIAKVAPELGDAELAAAYDRILRQNQKALGAPGLAPVASLASQAASRNRAEVIARIQNGAD